MHTLTLEQYLTRAEADRSSALRMRNAAAEAVRRMPADADARAVAQALDTLARRNAALDAATAQLRQVREAQAEDTATEMLLRDTTVQRREGGGWEDRITGHRFTQHPCATAEGRSDPRLHPRWAETLELAQQGVAR